ncbi:MAG: hypothetical protein NZ516_03200 [Raineya sp.]|nr:hypothetical protein [Raineya sp.]
MKPENNSKIKLPFGTPENYFEEFSSRLEKRLKGEAEPKGLHKTLPFKVPDRYFEWLPQRIMQKIQGMRTQIAWYEKIQWHWIGRMGAVTAVMVLLIMWFLPQKDTQTENLADLQKELAKVDKKELEYYLIIHHTSSLEAEILSTNADISINHSENLQDSLHLEKKTLEEVLPDENVEEILHQELENAEIL